jgi:cobalamin synthase
MQDTSDVKTGLFGLGANLVAVLFHWVEVRSFIDAAVIAGISLLVSFYGNRLLKYFHNKKKDEEA